MKSVSILRSLVLVALVAVCLVVMFSCKKGATKTPVPDEVEIKIPCQKEGRSDKNFFRADNSATSSDMSLSREKALLAAKQKLSSLIQSQLKSVTDRYVNETEVGKNSSFEQKFENLTREVVNQKLNDINITCEKNTFDKTNNKYTTYIAVEISKEDLLKGVNSGITKDEKLRVDYDKMKFEQIFNQEMEKMANSR